MHWIRTTNKPTVQRLLVSIAALLLLSSCSFLKIQSCDYGGMNELRLAYVYHAQLYTNLTQKYASQKLLSKEIYNGYRLLSRIQLRFNLSSNNKHSLYRQTLNLMTIFSSHTSARKKSGPWSDAERELLWDQLNIAYKEAWRTETRKGCDTNDVTRISR